MLPQLSDSCFLQPQGKPHIRGGEQVVQFPLWLYWWQAVICMLLHSVEGLDITSSGLHCIGLATIF